jgi:hypothetical protein
MEFQIYSKRKQIKAQYLHNDTKASYQLRHSKLDQNKIVLSGNKYELLT